VAEEAGDMASAAANMERAAEHARAAQDLARQALDARAVLQALAGPPTPL